MPLLTLGSVLFWVVSTIGIHSRWRALSHVWLLSSPPHLLVSKTYLQAFFQFSVLQTFSSSFNRFFIHRWSWLGLDFSLSPSVILVLPLLWLASQCAWLFVETSKGMNSKYRCSLFLPVWTRCCLMLWCLKLIRQSLHSPQRRLQGELLGEDWLLRGHPHIFYLRRAAECQVAFACFLSMSTVFLRWRQVPVPHAEHLDSGEFIRSLSHPWLLLTVWPCTFALSVSLHRINRKILVKKLNSGKGYCIYLINSI